ncbi:unnamed protein product, partial [Mesorhabditis belari]|uniref:Uncharacterized protein n=1 Tax=Mesorhabditis belari TaxID=2138241 RepID=A0AAF3FK54_9BILA
MIFWSLIFSLFIGKSLSLWKPFVDSLVKELNLAANPCNNLQNFICDANFPIGNLSFYERLGFIKPGPLGPQCDMETNIVKILRRIASKFDTNDLKKESSERMEFEFEKVRWDCERNLTCYEEKFRFYTALFHHADAMKTFQLPENKNVYTMRDAVHQVLKVIDEKSFDDFEALKWLHALASRRCSAYYTWKANRTPYRMAEFYKQLIRVHNAVFQATKGLIESDSISNETKWRIDLDRVSFFTPYDIYYNTPEFINSIYNLYEIDQLREKASKSTSMFDMKLQLLNTSRNAHVKMATLGVDRPLEIMSFVTKPTNRNSTMEKLSAFIEHNLSSPLKFATVGFLVANEILDQIWPNNDKNENSITIESGNCTEKLNQNTAALVIAWNALLQQKSLLYLQSPIPTKVRVFSRGQLFFVAAGVHFCSDLKDLPQKLFQKFDQIFYCSNGESNETCSFDFIGISKMKDTKIGDKSTEESGESVETLIESKEITTTASPNTQKFTAFFSRTTKKPKVITTNTFKKQITVAKSANTTLFKSVDLKKTSSPLSIPLGRLADNLTHPIILNLNITIISNTGKKQDENSIISIIDNFCWIHCSSPTKALKKIGHNYLQNKRVCVMERLTGVKHTFCPTSRPNDPIDWPCIRVDDLCNGTPQCPGGEDEDPDLCMFFQAQNVAFQQMKRKVVTMLKPYMETKTKTKSDQEFIKI